VMPAIGMNQISMRKLRWTNWVSSLPLTLDLEWVQEMADNYLQFSEMLETKDAEERLWLTDQLEYIVVEAGKIYLLDENPHADDVTWEGPRFLHGIEEFRDDWNEIGFTWCLEGDGLWIYTEESGNPDTAAMLIQAFFRKFHPKGIWKLEWAETCSKPRLNEFGGGAVVVTANDMYWMTSGEFTSEKISELISKEGLKEHVPDPS